MAASRRWRTKAGSLVRRPRPPSAGRFPRWVREGLGIALLGAAAFLLIALYSYSPDTDPGFFQSISPAPQRVKNLGGPVGAYSASLLKETLGVGSYLVVALVAWMAVPVIRGRSLRMAPWKLPVGLLALLGFSTLFSLAMPGRPSAMRGGIVGQQAAEWMLDALHPVGSYLILLVLLILSVAALGEFAFLAALRAAGALLVRGARWTSLQCAAGAGSLLQQSRRLFRMAADRSTAFAKTLRARLAAWRSRAKEPTPAQGPQAHPPNKTAPTIVNHAFKPGPKPPQEEPKPEPVASPKIVDPGKGEHPLATDSSALAGEPEPRRPVQTALPFPSPLPEGYRLPPLDLLDDPNPGESVVDEEALKESAAILENKLKDFGVEGRVSEIHPGPIITLFEYEPASGVKVNRIVNLADDLALAMKALSVRIVAPIPGKSVVGIEVPNRKRQMVTLKEILADEAFQACRWKIPLALGKDIAGKPVTTDLARMPHLLIAGATGTGKSVNLHSLILSILFRFSPHEVKFLMIDPKMLELTSYHGIPHLLHPVITDSRRASDVLDWAVERMEQRYQLLSEKGVRNIEGYNEKLEKESASLGSADPFPAVQEGDEADEGMAPERGKLPYIILVIDEMADLMIIAGRQIEEAITRLAQMARAAGIHLLLATQRPSVDVLTGIIKANLPARISFQVSSRIDSRTILDTIGAEKLLGRGDMLFLPPGTSKVARIHGPFVSEPEIERVVQYIKQHGRPRYEKIPFKSKKTKEEEETFEHDEKYDEAVQLVAETRQASISMIQRKLRVGYNRAARMIERMEQEGVVGPQEGVKPREVLISHLE